MEADAEAVALAWADATEEAAVGDDALSSCAALGLERAEVAVGWACPVALSDEGCAVATTVGLAD